MSNKKNRCRRVYTNRACLCSKKKKAHVKHVKEMSGCTQGGKEKCPSQSKSHTDTRTHADTQTNRHRDNHVSTRRKISRSDRSIDDCTFGGRTYTPRTRVGTTLNVCGYHHVRRLAGGMTYTGLFSSNTGPPQSLTTVRSPPRLDLRV